MRSIGASLFLVLFVLGQRLRLRLDIENAPLASIDEPFRRLARHPHFAHCPLYSLFTQRGYFSHPNPLNISSSASATGAKSSSDYCSTLVQCRSRAICRIGASSTALPDFNAIY